MVASWQDYLEQTAKSDAEYNPLTEDEPQNPEQWFETDSLMKWEVKREETRENLEDRIGWTYLSWRRLSRRHRIQARVERALAFALNQSTEGFSNRLGHIYGVSVGTPSAIESYLRWEIFGMPYFEEYPVRGLVGFLDCDTQFPWIVGSLSSKEVLRNINVEDVRNFLVIARPRITKTALRSVNTPTATSGSGHTLLIRSGQKIYGRSAAGILTPGTLAMFVERSGHSEPCILGAHHVFGQIGNDILDAGHNKIGRVSLAAPPLDASVADLSSPWAIDYQLPNLNIIPGVPLMPYVQMPVQIFGAESGHQTGYVTQTNYMAPSSPGAAVSNNILTSITAKPGDSGALLCSGYCGKPAVPAPFLSATPKPLQDYYTCAAVGILQGRASQGVGQTVGMPSVFGYVHDVLAALKLDPLTR